MKKVSLFPTQGTLGKIFSENVFATTHLTTGLPKSAKSSITRTINKIVRDIEPSGIKVGKTGQYFTRHKAKIYKDFDQMYIIYKSTSKLSVEYIEGYYITYLKLNFPNLCHNLKGGSAGKMESLNGYYYVYLALID